MIVAQSLVSQEGQADASHTRLNQEILFFSQLHRELVLMYTALSPVHPPADLSRNHILGIDVVHRRVRSVLEGGFHSSPSAFSADASIPDRLSSPTRNFSSSWSSLGFDDFAGQCDRDKANITSSASLACCYVRQFGAARQWLQCDARFSAR